MPPTLDPRLSRHTHRPGPRLSVWPGVALAQARVHEFCGRARRTLALMAAARLDGPVFWIAPRRGADPLNPEGIVSFIDPARLIFLSPGRGEDLLWCMEEVLRSGVVPLVVTDLRDPPPMTPVRRLHLAAETGAGGETGLTGAAGCAPMGLLLTPGAGGAAGIETRYQMEPAHLAGRKRWHLRRLRARMAPPQDWWLEQDRLTPVAQPDTALAAE
ncbi:ImuA family protein [Cognatishimia sp. F0-27]|uniref:ImuA family protein n=1 Tax=Cognatishimia sp. F0-27 TaxID=2816855 RepID=UPI001D0BFAC6|nr:hypothetical protein [Cognatishimia sp. F0-27]MCC1492101.1 hypothetical protein [Cognatishimia sp. F0-27]